MTPHFQTNYEVSFMAWLATQAMQNFIDGIYFYPILKTRSQHKKQVWTKQNVRLRILWLRGKLQFCTRDWNRWVQRLHGLRLFKKLRLEPKLKFLFKFPIHFVRLDLKLVNFKYKLNSKLNFELKVILEELFKLR